MEIIRYKLKGDDDTVVDKSTEENGNTRGI